MVRGAMRGAYATVLNGAPACVLRYGISTSLNAYSAERECSCRSILCIADPGLIRGRRPSGVLSAAAAKAERWRNRRSGGDAGAAPRGVQVVAGLASEARRTSARRASSAPAPASAIRCVAGAGGGVGRQLRIRPAPAPLGGDRGDHRLEVEIAGW